MIKRFISKSNFAKAVSVLVGGTALGQLINVLAAPVLTRLYTPEDFGVLAVFAALASAFVVISSFRYELAIPLAESVSAATNVLSLAISITIMISFLSVLMILFFGHDVAENTGVESIEGYLWLLPVWVLGASFYKIMINWSLRNKNFITLSKTKIWQSVAGVTVQLGGGVTGFGASGLIIGQLIGQSFGGMSLWRRARESSKFNFNRVSWLRIRVSAVRFKKFFIFDTPASLINTLSLHAPNLLLAVYFNPVVAGYFLIAQRVLMLPVSLLGRAIGQVLYSRSREFRKEGSLFLNLVKTISVLALLAVIPALIIFLYAPEIFMFVFGADWEVSGIFASWLIISITMQFLYSPVSLMLLATGNQGINLFLQFLQLVSAVTGLTWGYYAGDNVVAVMMYSAFTGSIYLLGLLIVFRVAYLSDVKVSIS